MKLLTTNLALMVLLHVDVFLPPGHHGRLRYEGEHVDDELARWEAARLQNAIAKKQLGDEDVLRILGTRNKSQLQATFHHYSQQSGTAIDEVVRTAVVGLWIDKDSHSRAIVTRAEIDMQKIKHECFISHMERWQRERRHQERTHGAENCDHRLDSDWPVGTPRTTDAPTDPSPDIILHKNVLKGGVRTGGGTLEQKKRVVDGGYLNKDVGV